MKHVLPELNFGYSDFEPYIDAKTMEIHYTKHHQAYVDKLNLALEKYKEFSKLELKELLVNLDKLPEEIKESVRNNGGGHWNHSFFWGLLTKNKTEPSQEFYEMIEETYGSFAEFKERFKNLALARFGSGWVWLTFSNGKLEIMTTANQDNPLMERKRAILGIDLWEHAYYLKYQNRRGDYIDAFWNVVNWDKVEESMK